MPLLKASKSEDVVDRWTNFWSVLLFLVLAVTTCLMPLQPESGNLNTPEFEPFCWCPAQFEESQIEYTHALCGKAFNDLIQGNHRTSTISKLSTDMRIPGPNVSSTSRIANTTQKEKSSDHSSWSKVPLALFLLAVLLKLPHFCGGLLSRCIGLLNIDQTLEHAVQVQRVEEINRRKALRNLSKRTKENIESRPRSLSAIYISVKLVSIVILFGAILGALRMTPISNIRDPRDNIPNVYNGVDVDSLYSCNFGIRHRSLVFNYFIQCAFTEIESENRMSNIPQYAAFFKAILAYLVLLLGANVVSVVIWLCRLTVRHYQPPSTSLAPGTALDLHFLLLLSHDNAGPFVTRDLAEGFTDRPNGAEDFEKDKEAAV